MKMKKCIVLFIIFFLFFFIQIELVSASIFCNNDYTSPYSQRGDCIDTSDFINPEEAPETPTETGESPTQTQLEIPFMETQTTSQKIMSQLITLIVEFFGMVMLFIILVLLLQTFIGSI